MKWLKFDGLLAEIERRENVAEVSKVMREENFTVDQVIDAIQCFLDYGENTLKEDKVIGEKFGHCGYFSGEGFPAKCLRSYIEHLKPLSKYYK